MSRYTKCDRCKGYGIARTYVVAGGSKWETGARPCMCVAGARFIGIGLKYADAAPTDFPEYRAFVGTEESPRVPTRAEGRSSPFLYGSFDDLYPGWYIYGRVGVGKTHLLAALTRLIALTREGEEPAAYFYSVNDLVADTKAGWDKDHGARRRLDRLDEADVVMLDDLAAEYVTEWLVAELTRLVDGWYREERPLVVTSNLSPGGLADKYGERLAGRIAEMTRAFEMTGPDRRLGGGEP